MTAEPKRPEDACGEVVQAAAWVLGALPDSEADRYRGHLATCAVCQHEVSELTPVVDVLAEAVPAATPPAELRDRVMSVVYGEAELLRAAGPRADRPPARERRRWRLAPPVAIAGALAAAAVGLVIGAFALGSGSSSPTTRTVLGASVPPSARIVFQETADHGVLDVSNMPGPGAGRVYQVWLQRPGEAPKPTDALFGVSRSGGHAQVAVPGDLHGVANVLVTSEPTGGSPNGKPSRPPVIMVSLGNA